MCVCVCVYVMCVCACVCDTPYLRPPICFHVTYNRIILLDRTSFQFLFYEIPGLKLTSINVE